MAGHAQAKLNQRKHILRGVSLETIPIRTIRVMEEPIDSRAAAQIIRRPVIVDCARGEKVRAIVAAAQAAVQVADARGGRDVRPSQLGHDGGEGALIAIVVGGPGDEDIVAAFALKPVGAVAADEQVAAAAADQDVVALAAEQHVAAAAALETVVSSAAVQPHRHADAPLDADIVVAGLTKNNDPADGPLNLCFDSDRPVSISTS
jgi:hypothetical protein